MFFGLDFEKLIIIGVFAAMIIGPQRLPAVAQSLARFAARAREWGRDGKARLKEELGDDFDDVEWRKLDPRQYDPRRIIRNALLEEPVPSVAASAAQATEPDQQSVAAPLPVRLDPLTGAPGASGTVLPATKADETPESPTGGHTHGLEAAGDDTVAR